MTRKQKLTTLFTAVVLVLALLLGCTDWDMDRSDWQPTPTAIPAQWPTLTPRGGER